MAAVVGLRSSLRFSFSSRFLSSTFVSLSRTKYPTKSGSCHGASVFIGFQRHSSTNQNAQVKMDKTLLARLRKETGFGFSKCCEALILNQNDYAAAEAWLHEQAQKEGWAKATKLQGRSASEGLVGVVVDQSDINMMAMVEVNCETDFVARNENFIDLVSMVTNTALAHRKTIVQKNQKLNMFGDQVVHLREVILTHDLRDLKIKDNPGSEIVSDIVVKVISKLGENVKLGRAITMTTDTDNIIGSYVHGPFVASINNCALGKYAAVVAVKPLRDDANRSALLSLANRLAQHVVGMNPIMISQDSGKAVDNANKDLSDVLVEQEFLLDGTLSVGELLDKEGVEVVDFVRYECGVK